MEQYFTYIACGTNDRITREDAVAVVRRTHGLLIQVHPGATPVVVEVRQLAGLVFSPVVKIEGRGWAEPAVAHRVGRALIEAAAIAAEAQRGELWPRV